MQALKAFIAAGLLSYLTVSPVWGQSDLTDRRHLVRHVFNSFDGYLEFLRSSAGFTRQLAADEAGLLSQLVALFSESSWNVAPRTRLEFSANRAEFMLGGVERTAKTSELRDDPVIFNLGLIQSPSFKMNALDVAQILVHEMAHKLGPAAEQAGERLGSKIRHGLEPYYQRFDVNTETIVHSLILPRVHQPTVFSTGRADPLILFEYRGRYIPAQFSLNGVGRGVNSRFWIDHDALAKNGIPSGNFQKQYLSKMTGLHLELGPEGEIELEVPLELTETLLYMDPVSRGWDVVAGSGMMRPVMNFVALAPVARNLIKIRRRTSLGWLKNWGHDSNMVNMSSGLFDPPEAFLPDVTGAQADLSLSNGQLSGALQAAGTISRVYARAGGYLWPVEWKERREGGYSLSGAIKAPQGASENLEISHLVLNGTSLVELSRKIRLGSRAGRPVSKAIDKIQAEAGGRWVDLRELAGSEVSHLKLRIAVPEGFGAPYQVQAKWTAPIQILWSAQKVAESHDELLEVLQAGRLKRLNDGGQVWIEFEAKEIFRPRSGPAAQGKISYPDSLERVLNSLVLMDDDGNRARFVSEETTFRDRPFFKIRPCEAIFL